MHLEDDNCDDEEAGARVKLEADGDGKDQGKAGKVSMVHTMNISHNPIP